jgi:hypothetical protein
MTTRVLSLAVCLAAACAAQDRVPEPHTITIGGVTLRPGGFVDTIGMSRSASTPDTISTHFGSIPLDATSGQSFVSLRNSRIQLMGDREWSGIQFTGYFESDFLNVTPQQSDYRWRQYWGRARFGKWELLGGQAWSLLRPNRKGFDSDHDLMNTDVIDAAYHVGLLGSRRRQFRIGRSFGDYKAAFAWETQGNFLARVTADKRFGHVEATAFTGHRGRRGVTVASTANLTPRLRFVTQEYWSKRAIFEALGVAGQGPNGMAAIQGLEFAANRYYEIYSYGGLVYASHSTGNRLVREWTLGADRRMAVPSLWGNLLMSLQFTKTDRFTWAGRSNDMTFVMYRLRYTFL